MKCKTCITKAICRHKQYEELFSICPFLHKKFKINKYSSDFGTRVSFSFTDGYLIRDLYDSLQPTTWHLELCGLITFIRFWRKQC